MYKEERERRGRRRRRKLERGENSKSFSFVTSLVISYTRKLSPRISANHPSSSLSPSLPFSHGLVSRHFKPRTPQSRRSTRSKRLERTNEFMKYPSSVRIYYFRAVSLTFRFYARGEKG